MKIFNTRLFGLDLSQNNKDVKDTEVIDMKNMTVDRHGQLVKRGGLRLLNENNKSLDNELFNLFKGKRIKYKQIFTQSKEYLDVFAVENKVYIYNEEANTFVAIYEAPGTAEVDIDSYLGYILVTSHDSNLAIIKKYNRNVFIQSKSAGKIIRSKGIYTAGTPNVMNFVEEDSLTEADLEDFDIDEAYLYVLSKTTGGAQSKTVTPVSPADNEIETAGFTINDDNNYIGPMQGFVGYDHIDRATIAEKGTVNFKTIIRGYNSDNGISTYSNHETGVLPQTEYQPVRITEEHIDDFNASSGQSLSSDFKVKRKFTGKLTHNLITGVLWGIKESNKNITAGGIKINNTQTGWAGSTSIIEPGAAWIAYTENTLFYVPSVEISYVITNGTTNLVSKITLPVPLLWLESTSMSPYALNYPGLDSLEYKALDIRVCAENDGGKTLFGYVASIIPLAPGWSLLNLLDATPIENAIKVFRVLLNPAGEISYLRNTSLNNSLISNDSEKQLGYRDVGYFQSSELPIYEVIVDGTTIEYLDAPLTARTVNTPERQWQIKYKANNTKINVGFTIDYLSYNQDNLNEWAYKKTTFLTVSEIVEKDESDFILNTWAFYPYLRIVSKINSDTLKQRFSTPKFPFTFNRIDNPIIYKDSVAPYSIDISIAAEFKDQGVHTEDNTSKDAEYDFTFDATSADEVRIRVYDKDNLDINNTLTPEAYKFESISAVLFCKSTVMLIYLEDAAGKYLLAQRRSGEDSYSTAVMGLDETSYGTPIALKSFISPNGKWYACVLTDICILIVDYDSVNNELNIIDFIEDDYFDVPTFNTTNTETGLYFQSKTTPFKTYKLSLVYDGGSFGFKRDSVGNIVVESDYKILDQYVTTSAANSRIVFSTDDKEHKILLIADKAAITYPAGTAFAEWKVNGATPTTYDKILSDLNYTKLEQIKPITTPAQLSLNEIAGSATLTGTYQYFAVVVEKDASTGGNILYESYPSDYSDKITVARKDIKIDLTVDYTRYYDGTINTPEATFAELWIYRTKKEANDITKTTAFNLVKIITDLTTPKFELDGVSKKFELSAKWTDTVSDATAEGNEMYRGYTNYYPRCNIVEVYNNIVYLANDQRYRNNIYFSELFDPTAWTPGLTLSTIGTDFANDEITALVKADGLYIFTRDEIQLLTGIGLNVTKQLITKQIGCIDPRTVTVVDGNIVFLSEKGLYYLKGYQYQPIDDPVSRLTNDFTFNSGVIAFFDNYTREYRLVYDDNKVISFSFPLKMWFKSEYPYAKIMMAFVRENKDTDLWETCFLVSAIFNAPAPSFFALLVEDKDINYDFQGKILPAPITAEVATKYYDMGNGYNYKQWRRVHIDTTDTGDVNALISVDQGEYTPMVQNVRRATFDEVPYMWLRFNGLYGKTRDYGKRGGIATPVNVVRNQNGKVDRTYLWEMLEGSRVKIKDIKQLYNSVWAFWVKQTNLYQNFFGESAANIINNEPQGWIPGADVSWADADWTDFSDCEDVENSECSVLDDLGFCSLSVGNMVWTATEILPDTTFEGEDLENIPGQLQFFPQEDGVWDQFSDEAEGLKDLLFDKDGVGCAVVEGSLVVL